MLCPDRTYLLTSSARPVCTSIQYRPHSQLLNCQRTTAACRAADGQPTWLENAAAPEQPSSPPQPFERQPPWNLSFDIRERETDWTDENKVSHEITKIQHWLGSGPACMERRHIILCPLGKVFPLDLSQPEESCQSRNFESPIL